MDEKKINVLFYCRSSKTKLMVHLAKEIQEVLENAFPEEKFPDSIQLFHNYPNPFNSTTTIHYDLPKDTRIIVKIYNLFGQEVKTLVNRNQMAGYQSVIWDGKDNLDTIVSSGTYIYRLQADDKIKVKKMLYIK